MAKLLFAVLIAYAGWWLWRGPRRRPVPSASSRPATPDGAERAAARAVLGLGDDADEIQIRAAHRRLVAAVHPDRGGSADLTRRINAARDTLLQRPPSN